MQFEQARESNQLKHILRTYQLFVKLFFGAHFLAGFANLLPQHIDLVQHSLCLSLEFISQHTTGDQSHDHKGEKCLAVIRSMSRKVHDEGEKSYAVRERITYYSIFMHKSVHTSNSLGY